jgi:hypothetical protein
MKTVTDKPVKAAVVSRSARPQRLTLKAASAEWLLRTSREQICKCFANGRWSARRAENFCVELQEAVGRSAEI